MPRPEEVDGVPRRGTIAAALDAPAGEPAVHDGPTGDTTVADASSGDAPAVAGSDAPGPFDAVHVRNYDHRRRHAVTVTLADPGGDERQVERCSLASGRGERLPASVEPGRYELRVRVDGVERARTACRLGPGPAGTAVVELGNGAVSVTTGADDLAPAT